MKNEYLLDVKGKIVGHLVGDWLLDGKGKQVARVDKSSNRTLDKNGHIVGQGDQRLRQLEKDRPNR
jgi:hypothetical protein